MEVRVQTPEGEIVLDIDKGDAQMAAELIHALQTGKKRTGKRRQPRPDAPDAQEATQNLADVLPWPSRITPESKRTYADALEYLRIHDSEAGVSSLDYAQYAGLSISAAGNLMRRLVEWQYATKLRDGWYRAVSQNGESRVRAPMTATEVHIWDFLRANDRKQGVDLHQICSDLDMRYAPVTSTLDRLVKKGYAERTGRGRYRALRRHGRNVLTAVDDKSETGLARKLKR